jgi:toxin HigB-1
MSIKSFANQGTEDIFYSRNTQKARKQVDMKAWPSAHTMLLLLHTATKLAEMTQTPGMRLEQLKHDKPGFYSVRVNNRYRMIFTWKDGDAYDVSVEDPKHHEP